MKTNALVRGQSLGWYAEGGNSIDLLRNHKDAALRKKLNQIRNGPRGLHHSIGFLSSGPPAQLRKPGSGSEGSRGVRRGPIFDRPEDAPMRRK